MNKTFLLCAIAIITCDLHAQSDPLEQHYKNLYVDSNVLVLNKLENEKLKYIYSYAEYADIFLLTESEAEDTDQRFIIELESIYVTYSKRIRITKKGAKSFFELMPDLLSSSDSENGTVDSYSPKFGFRIFSKQNVMLMEGSMCISPTPSSKGRIGNYFYSVEPLATPIAQKIYTLVKSFFKE